MPRYDELQPELSHSFVKSRRTKGVERSLLAPGPVVQKGSAGFMTRGGRLLKSAFDGVVNGVRGTSSRVKSLWNSIVSTPLPYDLHEDDEVSSEAFSAFSKTQQRWTVRAFIDYEQTKSIEMDFPSLEKADEYINAMKDGESRFLPYKIQVFRKAEFEKAASVFSVKAKGDDEATSSNSDSSFSNISLSEENGEKLSRIEEVF